MSDLCEHILVIEEFPNASLSRGFVKRWLLVFVSLGSVEFIGILLFPCLYCGCGLGSALPLYKKSPRWDNQKPKVNFSYQTFETLKK